MMFQRAGRSVLAAAALVCLAAAAFAQVPSSQRVILVINENSTYDDVIANMPWLISQGNANGYATKYQSDNGGSLMDYLWLASGSCHSKANCTLPSGTHDFNCSGNDCSSPITDDNIFRQMNNAGISWKVYAQSYAAAGGTPSTPDNRNGTSYYRRHNGATWYSDILDNTKGSANNIVDLSQLTTDLDKGNLPRFMIIVPDGNHDAHDCPVGLSSCTEAQKLAAADDFLNSTLGPVLATSDFQPGGDGLAIVTFDECGGGTNEGCGASVYTAVIGPKVTPHTVSKKRYKHENALRTMLDALGIRKYPGAADSVSDMSDFFSNNGSEPEVTVSSPANGSTMPSPIPIDASASPSAGHSITGWWVYVDNVGVYNKGAVSTISPKISMSDGKHTVVVRAWNSSGNFGDQTLNLTVNASKPTVTISAPSNNASVGSPMNLKASATASSGQKITGWWVYVDSKATYNTGDKKSINTNLTMDVGKHTVLVRAWDSSGSYSDQTITVTVQQIAVTVTKPANGATKDSPVTIAAKASSNNTITGWKIYVDSVESYEDDNKKNINASISMKSGTHTVLVRAWDSIGAFGDQTVTVSVR